MDSIKYVRPGKGYVPNFIMGEKLEVNGAQEHPLFSFLKRSCPATRDGFSKKEDLYYHPFKNWDIRWNWEKFLVDRNGHPVMRYDASTEPIGGITHDIEVMLRSEL